LKFVCVEFVVVVASHPFL